MVPVFSGTCWDDRIDGIIRDPVFILECSFQLQNRQDSTRILWFTLCGLRNEDRSKLSMTGVLTRSNFWHPGSPSHPIIMADHPEPDLHPLHSQWWMVQSTTVGACIVMVSWFISLSSQDNFVLQCLVSFCVWLDFHLRCEVVQTQSVQAHASVLLKY